MNGSPTKAFPTSGESLSIRVANWVLIVFGFVAIALAIRSMFIAGIAYDALVDAQVSIAIRTLDPNLTLDQAYDAIPSTIEFYGVLQYQIADFFHQLVMQTSGLLSPEEPSTYIWQESITLAYSVLATGVLALAMARVLRSRLGGTLTWAILLATPLWLGMSTIDYKDVPVAAGLTLISAGVMWSWTGATRRDQVIAIASAALGGVIALGTRAGSLPLIAALPLISLAVFGLAQFTLRSPRRLLPIAVLAVTTPLVAVFTIWMTNPIARINLPQWLIDSFTTVRNFPWVNVVRTAGWDVQSDNLPRWYVPAWLLANLPLLTTALACFGIVCFLVSAIRRNWGIGRDSSLSMTPLVVQGAALPLAVIASGAVLYDGIRHLLFLLPPVAAVMAVGVVSLQRELRSPRPALVVAVLVVAASLFAVVRWFPYHYAFINPLAGIDKSQRTWELDYWGITAREGVSRLKAVGLDPIAVIPAAEPSRPFGGLTSDEVNKIAPPPKRSGIYAFLRWDARILEQWCGVTFTISRDGQTLGQGGYCPK